MGEVFLHSVNSSCKERFRYLTDKDRQTARCEVGQLHCILHELNSKGHVMEVN